MIVLPPFRVCPFGCICKYSRDCLSNRCRGLDVNRGNVFICELWSENYETKELNNARNNPKFSPYSSS